MARTCIGKGFAFRVSSTSMAGEIELLKPMAATDSVVLALTDAMKDGRRAIACELFRVEYPVGDPLHIDGVDDDDVARFKMLGA